MHGKNQISIQAVLNGLGNFSYIAPNDTCVLCSRDFGEVIRSAVEKVQENFDGLCLDCIDNSQTRDWDREYDKHAQWNKESYRCRFSHDQPTWYFSCLSRKQVPDAHEREREKRKREGGTGHYSLGNLGSVI
jgi:hypothetical protein